MEFTNEVYGALDRYYSLLSRTGYKSYDQVYNLVALTFIEEMLCGPMSVFITEEDYNSIMEAVSCLYGSCLIPYPVFKRGIDDKVIGKPYSCRVKTEV